MRYLVLRVDFDGAEDGARWMVVSIDETSIKRYKSIVEVLKGLNENMHVRKIVLGENTFDVFRINPLTLASVPDSLHDNGWGIFERGDIDFDAPYISAEYHECHIDTYGELCFTADYKHTDFGIRSCYLPISEL